MKNSTIENLAYRIKQAKDNGEPKPIVFLGAGASKSGGIPLANEIVADILEHFKKNPDVCSMKEEDRSYPKLMNCLTPFERNKLLKGYIDNAKINVTHIYLAQLVHLGYVDYVLTVNFDNLMLRALALYNEFPPTYDMAILKDLTTTTFKEKSVLYLHGQHYGLWLLNTEEEMDKVKEYVPPILNKITNQRMWVFIGYSGYDPIFKHVVNLGRFDNGLYWICYKDSNPNENVCADLLDKPNTNASIIKGYDADAFMLKLNQALELPQPSIFDTPFSSLEEQLKNIVDIDDEEHFRGVKERLEIVKSQVETAINQFEKGVVETEVNAKDDADINRLRKEIIDKSISGKFDEAEIAAIEEKAAKIENAELNSQLADLYINWGNVVFEKAGSNKDESLYKQAIEKYEKATVLNPQNDAAFYNWGNALSDLAEIKNDESLYQQSFEKYEKALALNPQKDEAYNNWGIALSDLAKLKDDEVLYHQAIAKYEKAAALNPQNNSAYNNWGNALTDLAKLKNDELLYHQAIENYGESVVLNPQQDVAFYNWGGALLYLAKLKNDSALYRRAIKKLTKAFELGGSAYNLACSYALMNEKENALKYLEHSLQNNQTTAEFVKQDEDWKAYAGDEDFKALLAKYSDGGKE